jgi:membrane protease YdiL (CAAX protease family)
VNEPVADVTFDCQECGRSITFPGERRGHVEECPECHNYVDVPYQTESSRSPELAAAASQPGTDEPPKGPATGPRTSGQLWIEVMAVLCLAYVPYLFSALTATLEPNPTSYSFGNGMLYRIISALRVSMPLLVILALGRDSWRLFGIVPPKWITDVLLGCVIWLTGLIVKDFAICLLSPVMLQKWAFVQVAHQTRPEGTAVFCLLFVTCLAGAFSEELVMRGYLIPRLERLLRSTWVAILVTSALFASYHAYQGITPVIAHVATGLFYAVWFCLLRRLWPLCLAHALHNFILYM